MAPQHRCKLLCINGLENPTWVIKIPPMPIPGPSEYRKTGVVPVLQALGTQLAQGCWLTGFHAASARVASRTGHRTNSCTP